MEMTHFSTDLTLKKTCVLLTDRITLLTVTLVDNIFISIIVTIITVPLTFGGLVWCNLSKW